MRHKIAQNNFLNIGRGATLDLNGNSQWVFGLFTDGLLDGAGGTITSTGGTASLVTNLDTTRAFAGSITGPINFAKSGLGSTLTTRHLLYAKEAEAALGLPEGVHSYAILPIGWPMGKFGPVGRTKLEDVVFNERWGQPYA